MAVRAIIKQCMVLLLIMPSMAWASELIDVRYNDLSNKQVQLEFIFAENIIAASDSLNSDPAELVIDFSMASSELNLTSLPENAVGLKSILSTNIGENLRLAIALKDKVDYHSSANDNIYTVTLGTPDTAATGTENTEQQVRSSIALIDFKLNEKQQGELSLLLQDSSLVVDVIQNANRLELKIAGAAIDEEDLYTMDVMDFATPVRSFETFRDQDGVRVVVEMMKAFEFEHTQRGEEFILTVKAPLKKSVRPEAKKKKVFSGKRMSLNFQKVEVRTALQIIADYNQFNLVTGDSVDGEITLRLEDVPWDQALDMILKLKGLGKRIEGNILLIAPADELSQREASELKADKEVEELVPLYSEYIQINYAKASQIATLLDAGESSLLSERGTVAVDERTNTLLVQDTAKKLEDVRRLIEILDIAVKQVVIEARIVTVTDNVNEEFGIRWGITDTISDGATSGSIIGADSASGGVVPSLNDRLNVNLPVSESAGTIAFQVAKLANGTILDLELSALERENKGEIIARPSITTANQKPAYIEQGTEIPYVSAASSGATTVTFKPAVLSLRVTPQITPDNRVILDLVITQDTRGDTVKTAIGEAVAIDTQKIGTQVLVDNGETIVLGGIYQQQLINAVTKVPVLGDVPLLGWMFRTQKEFTERRELLIFVTPRIINSAR